MALVRDEDGKRLHVKSRLMGESLVSREFIDQLEIAPQERLYPEVAVMKIGGQSICDRGINALPGILKEIVANRDDHKILILTGGGTRSRHIYTIGLEMGMPTGIIARFGSMISDQNALMIATLLSPWGGIKISLNCPPISPKALFLSCTGCPLMTTSPSNRKKGESPLTAQIADW
jgi:molybdenum storage protein